MSVYGYECVCVPVSMYASTCMHAFMCDFASAYAHMNIEVCDYVHTYAFMCECQCVVLFMCVCVKTFSGL